MVKSQFIDDLHLNQFRVFDIRSPGSGWALLEDLVRPGVQHLSRWAKGQTWGPKLLPSKYWENMWFSHIFSICSYRFSYILYRFGFSHFQTQIPKCLLIQLPFSKLFPMFRRNVCLEFSLSNLVGCHSPDHMMVLWMEEILHHQKDGWTPINNGMFTTVLNWCFTPPLAASEAGAHGIDVHQLLPRSEEHDALSMMVGAWMVEIETQWINVVYMFVYVMHVCVLKHIYI